MAFRNLIQRLVLGADAETQIILDPQLTFPEIDAFYTARLHTVFAGIMYKVKTGYYFYEVLVSPNAAQGGKDAAYIARGIYKSTGTPTVVEYFTGIYDNLHSAVSLGDGGILLINSATPTAQADMQAYGHSVGRGLWSRAILTNTSAAIGAETAVLALPSTTYLANRAYRIYASGRFTMSASGNFPTFNVRKTNVAGAAIATWTKVPAADINDTSFDLWATFTVGNADVTVALVMTAAASAGTVLHQGTALRPRKIEIFDLGSAGDYPTDPILS